MGRTGQDQRNQSIMLLRAALCGSGASAITIPPTSHCQLLACLCTSLGFPQLRTHPHTSQSLALLWNAPALALVALAVSN